MTHFVSLIVQQSMERTPVGFEHRFAELETRTVALSVIERILSHSLPKVQGRQVITF